MIVKLQEERISSEGKREAAGLDLSCFFWPLLPWFWVFRWRDLREEKGSVSQAAKERKRGMLQALIINTPTAAFHESFMSKATETCALMCRTVSSKQR